MSWGERCGASGEGRLIWGQSVSKLKAYSIRSTLLHCNPNPSVYNCASWQYCVLFHSWIGALAQQELRDKGNRGGSAEWEHEYFNNNYTTLLLYVYRKHGVESTNKRRVGCNDCSTRTITLMKFQGISFPSKRAVLNNYLPSQILNRTVVDSTRPTTPFTHLSTPYFLNLLKSFLAVN